MAGFGQKRTESSHGIELALKGQMMKKGLLTIAVVLICICGAARSTELRDVSMVQLIANPQQYDSTQIRLIAFLNLEFEGNALYFHREDFENSISLNGIWISLTDQQERTSKKLNGGYVLIEGTFSAKDKGHLGMFSGSVQRITRIQSWGRRRK